MNKQIEKAIMEEIIKRPGDFFLKHVCNFLETKETRIAFFALSGSQLKGLEAAFSKPEEPGKKRKDNLKAFILKQCEKEKRRKSKQMWQVLGSIAEDGNGLLCKFLFEFNFDFWRELEENANIIMQNHLEDAHPTLAHEYLESTEVEDDIKEWRKDTVHPIVTKNLFYTLLAMHREKHTEDKQYKDKKEALCPHLID